MWPGIQLVSLWSLCFHNFILEQFFDSFLVITSDQQFFTFCLPVLVCLKNSGHFIGRFIPDFKFCTCKGISAIQMDIKIDGLTYDIIAEAFEKCRKGRLYILDEIIKPVIAEPRHELSRWAPKMFSMMIPTDKIKDVIGKGGKVIQDICATCNCKIDVQEDGHVFVSAVDQEDAKRAIFTIRTIVEDPEIGAIYKGKVTRLMNFGAFVEIAPGKEGLVHISKLDTKRVERVEDVVAVGDAIVVKVTDIDQQGRINLSRRDAILALEAKKAQQEQG